MSRINSRDRNLSIVAITAAILLGLSIAGRAEADPSGHGGRGHGQPMPPVASSYDPAKSVVRDHRTPVGSSASPIPNAGKRQ